MSLSGPNLEVKIVAGSGRFFNIYVSGKKEREGFWQGRKEGGKGGGREGRERSLLWSGHLPSEVTQIYILWAESLVMMPF